MQSIREEARKNSKTSLDLDNLRSFYYDYDDINDIKVTFPSPQIYAFEKNFFILLSKCSTVDFKTNWIQRPDYVSHEYYGNTIFWPIILYVNMIDSIEDFVNLKQLLIPSYDSILDLAKDKRTISLYEDINQPAPSNSKTSKYRVFPFSRKEVDKLKAKDNLSGLSEYPESPVVEFLRIHDRQSSNDSFIKYMLDTGEEVILSGIREG